MRSLKFYVVSGAFIAARNLRVLSTGLLSAAKTDRGHPDSFGQPSSHAQVDAGYMVSGGEPQWLQSKQSKIVSAFGEFS